MARSTTEHLQKFRRRRLVAFTIELCSILVAPVVAVSVIIFLVKAIWQSLLPLVVSY